MSSLLDPHAYNTGSAPWSVSPEWDSQSRRFRDGQVQTTCCLTGTASGTNRRKCDITPFPRVKLAD